MSAAVSCIPDSSASVLCLVRHGETDWNVERRLQGHQDIPLNAEGCAQAAALGAALADTSFDAIYSSDLQRALQTAAAVARNRSIAVQALEVLRERNFGVFQGHTRAEAQLLFPDMQPRVTAREPDFVPPDGESLRQCYERVSTALETMADRHAGQRILLVVHGGVLDAVRRHITGRALDLPRDFELGNAALNWIVRENGQWLLRSWNEQAHLQGSRDELEI